MIRLLRNNKRALFQSVVFGLITALVFALIWQSPFPKFKVEVDPFALDRGDETIWFVDDFDGDGNSERIRCFHGVNSNSLDIVHYDFRGEITGHYQTGTDEWPTQLDPAIIDIGNDKQKELVFFSIRNDSIFLNLFSLTRFERIGNQKFFAEFKHKVPVYACSSVFKELGDFDNNGNDELFFSFDAGYGLYPRGIFRIDFPSMEIKGSNTGYMKLGISEFKDLDQNGIPEILVVCGAPNNTEGMETDQFPDTLSFLTILNYDLSFFLPPIPFPGVYSTVGMMSDPKNPSHLFARYYCRTNYHEPLKVMTISLDGNVLHNKSWENIENPETMRAFFQEINKVPYLLISDIGRFKLTGDLSNLPQKLDKRKNKITSNVETLDLNEDGSDELIYPSAKNEVVIYNEKTKTETRFEAPISIDYRMRIYEKIREGKIIKYVLVSSGGFFQFTYSRNRLFYLNFLVYFFVFGASLFVVAWIIKSQQLRMEQKWETEKQLSELQFNSVKNQLNPHFLFNALNSVAYMIQKGNKEEAYDFLSMNSRMVKQMINDAKEVKRSLRKELQFTKDFVDIQQHRFEGRFTSSFEIDPLVNLDFEVPKMCIHTYVENAIKHGFRDTRSGGKLLVKIEPLQQGIEIEISDNGMGRKAAEKYHDSAGTGVSIMNEFYRLFEKYHGYNINFSQSDPESGSGTRILLSIRKKTDAQLKF